MEQIGYSLIDAQGHELQVFGDIAGQTRAVPDVIRLPNGNDVHCPAIGIDYDGVKLVERWLQVSDKPSTAFYGSKIVVSRPSSPPETVEQKLESVGLSIDDLKSALGIS